MLSGLPIPHFDRPPTALFKTNLVFVRLAEPADSLSCAAEKASRTGASSAIGRADGVNRAARDLLGARSALKSAIRNPQSKIVGSRSSTDRTEVS